ADMMNAKTPGSAGNEPLKLLEYTYEGDFWAKHGVGSRQPPVWLTVLGHDGYWPIATLTPLQDPNLPKSSLMQAPSPDSEDLDDKPLAQTDHPALALSSCMTLVGGTLITVFALLHATWFFLWWFNQDPSKDWRIFTGFRPRQYSRWQVQQKIL